jgi:hypothetical protein
MAQLWPEDSLSPGSTPPGRSWPQLAGFLGEYEVTTFYSYKVTYFTNFFKKSVKTVP